MDVSQQLNLIDEEAKAYDDTITITDIAHGNFPAVTSNEIAEGASTREITVTIMKLAESPGGTMEANPGLFIRQENETAVKVSVVQDGSELASNTTEY